MTIQQFINTCDQGCFDLIPTEFVDQATAGQKFFVVNHEMLKGNQVRIGIEEIGETEAGISFRLRLVGMIDSEGNLVPLRRDARGSAPSDSEAWLSGFRTGKLTITQAMLDKGIFSEHDVEALLTHAELWAEHGDEMYSNKELSRKRLYLTSKNDTGLFRFQLEERQSPNPNSKHPIVPGIIVPSWRAMTVIGSGISQQAELGDFDNFDNFGATDDVTQVVRERSRKVEVKPGGTQLLQGRRQRQRQRSN